MQRFMRLGVLSMGLLLSSSATADTLTYTNVTVRNGGIDNQDLTGQTAEITIEFADGLVASGGKFTLGVISYASYEFSGAGFFEVDAPQDNLEFGSLGGGAWDLSFYDEDFNPLGMLSGCTAGRAGMVPLDGETMQDVFDRLGNGSEIQFSSSTDFQMLNAVIGTLNNGASNITGDIVGMGGSQVTLTYGGSTGYRLTVSGSCPGQLTVSWRGADANATQALVLGFSQGSFTIPRNFPCAGTVIGVTGSVRLVDPPGYFSTGNGQGQISGRAGTAACGKYLQLVHGGTCAVSNVRQIP